MSLNLAFTLPINLLVNVYIRESLSYSLNIRHSNVSLIGYQVKVFSFT